MPSSNCIINLYELSNYTFEKKESLLPKDPSIPAGLHRLKTEYEINGPRRSVEAVLLVHQHNLPHVLLLQISPNSYILPGGELDSDESVNDGLRRFLIKYFGKNEDLSNSNYWDIVDVVGNWWRPNFEQHQYPFIPAQT